MREILFRGKSKGKPEWVYGSLYKEGSQVFILVGGRFYPEPSNGQSALGIMDWYEVFPDSIGQFTGLTDKNGQKIFEGDIVKCHAIETTEVVIVEDIRKIPVQFKWVDIYNGATIKIIGNIHDNPELLT